MRHGISTRLGIVTLLAAAMLLLTHTWARTASPFRDLDLLIDIRHELLTGYVEELDSSELNRAAVEGMVNDLNDPHTDFLTPEDLERFERQIKGEFSGIGAEVDEYEGRVRIITPLPDSPAWHAGVMAGDIIIEIEGESTLNMSLNEAVDRLTGEAGTDVTFTVRHDDGEEQEITVTRDRIRIQSVRGLQRGNDQHFQHMLDAERGIAYIWLTQFNDNTVEEMAEVLDQLGEQGMRALIVDVRFNPGGLLEEAREVVDLFLPPGARIVSVRGRAGPEQVLDARYPATIGDDIPVVVLANEASASAAEILAGSLKDHDRALIVGSRTFGKGSVQQIRMLEGGQGALKMTNAYYYLPSGRLVHRRDDSEQWGVDPSEGAYVGLSARQMRDMLERRRQNDVLRHNNGDDDPAEQQPLTPERIEADLLDPQLAAALRAAIGRLETGNWPTVGAGNVQARVSADERDNLLEERERLQERLSEIERQLEAVDTNGAEAPDDAEPEADATRDDDQAPETGADVEIDIELQPAP
ncbi:MAG: S41 family peptidase [Phycisphaeraceae bacterium]